MCEEYQKKLEAMLDMAETDAERDFWRVAIDVLGRICEGQVLKVVRDDGAVLMVKMSRDNAIVVDGAEGKVGFLDPASAATTVVLWIRDGGELTQVTDGEFNRFRLEVMSGR